MTDARTFLATLLPELPPNGPFGPVGTYFFVSLGGKYAVHEKCASVDDIIQFGHEASAQGLDAYMALASYGITGGRKQNNVIGVRSVWADIDVGKGGSPYENQAQALQAVGKFATDTGLTPTYIVSSGAGLHVYWGFIRNVDVATYREIASGLKRCTTATRLSADPARATDAASILRIPGTVHRKSGRTVSILTNTGTLYDPQDFFNRCRAFAPSDEGADGKAAEALPPLQTLPSLPDDKEGSLGRPDGELAKQLGVAPADPTADAELIARGCKQIAYMGYASYTVWFNAMSVLRRCHNGKKWAHALSSLDKERYNREQTETKFVNSLPDNPCLCATFKQNNPEKCEGCQYDGRIKTPVQISKLAHKPAVSLKQPKVVGDDGIVSVKYPEAVDFPRIVIKSDRFKVDHRGIVLVTSQKNEDGTWTSDEKVMCTAKMYYKYARLKYVDKRPTRQHVFEVESQSGKSMEVWFDITQDFNKFAILRWFANAGMFLTSSEFSEKHLMSLMTTYLENVINTAPEFNCYDRFGWYEAQDPMTKELVPSFATGSGLVDAKGMTHVTFAEGAQHIADTWFCHKGDLEKWKFVPQMYRVLGQPIGMLAQCMSFAAPLMKYGSGEAQNCILSIYSNKSGRGKSSILRAAASIWGDPSKQFFTQQESVSARCRRLGILNNMPAFMDEITNASDEELADLSYTLIGGKEKHKLRSSGAEFVKTGDWSTCIFTTSNGSFKAALSKQYGVTDARLLRVMEYECDFKQYHDQPKVMEYINMCMAMRDENYGLAGPHFMLNLLQKPERLDTATIKAEHWSMKHGFRSDERFLAYPLALAMQAGRWACEFGLLDYDMDALEQWCIKEFTSQNRAATEEFKTKTLNVLAEYLNSRLQSTLVVVDEERGDEMVDPGNAAAPDPYIIYRPVREVTVRIVRDAKACYFARYDFIKWCQLNGYNYKAIIDDIKKNYEVPVSRARVDLGKNVSWLSTPRIYCFKVFGEGWLKLGYDIPEETTIQPTVNVEDEDDG